MSFKKIESSSSGSIPFFDEWKKELQQKDIDFLNGKLQEPKTIKEVISGKGYMVNFDADFNVFIFKNSSVGKAFKKMIKDETGFQFLIEYNKTKKGISLTYGFDEEVEVAFLETNYEEQLFTMEVTNGDTTPIAPDDDRLSLLYFPIPKPSVPNIPTRKIKSADKTNKRSDGVEV